VLVFVVRRVLVAVPLLLLTITLVFLVFALIPGDPAVILAGETANRATVEAIRQRYGLDRPLIVRYGIYLRQMVQGDLGASIFTGVPVTHEVRARFTKTLELAACSLGLAVAVGVLLGVAAALKRNTIVDDLATVVALGGISIPGFWLGLLLIYAFSVQYRWFPTGGTSGWRALVLPTVTLSVFSIAYITRITRALLLEVISQDYVRTARAKGVPGRSVVLKHALRNAMIPLVTVVGLRLGVLLTGSVVTESIFAWPGLGRLMVTAVNNRDYPIIQGVLLIFAMTFVFVNLLIDLCYAILDPRITYD
jgi:peptide/nickel transport system permease protein